MESAAIRTSWIIFFGFLLSGVLRPAASQQGQRSACATSVDTDCGRAFTNSLGAAAGDTAQVCRATDVMVGCSANVIAACDAIDQAEVSDGIKNSVINIFSGPQSQTQCQLANASLPVYAPNACSAGLSLCFGVLADAEVPTQTQPGLPAAVDPTRACLYYDGFTRCIGAELTTCSAEIAALVASRAAAAEIKFNTAPYTCANQQGPLKFQECMGAMQRSINPGNRDATCQAYKQGKACILEAKALSTAQQASSYDNDFNSFAQFLLDTPYFCEADNPCMEVFKICNSTATRGGLDHPCDLYQVYDSCGPRAISECTDDYRPATSEAVEQAKQFILDTYLCSATVPPVSASSKNAACDAVAQTCSQGLSQGISDAQGDTVVICATVDALLDCVIQGSDVCDPVAKVELVDAIGPVIEAYTNPDFTNCNLKNADHPDLQQNACDGGIANCSRILFNAEVPGADSIQSVLLSCQEYAAYIQCTQSLVTCDDVRRVAVNEYVTNATKKFSNAPYHCIERQTYDIDRADGKFAQCENNFKSSFQSNSNDYDSQCQFLATLSTCKADADRTASPRQMSIFNSIYNDLSSPLLVQPYFCMTDNPCQERYLMCSEPVTSSRANETCLIMSMLDNCVNQVQGTCSAEQLTGLTEYNEAQKIKYDKIVGCNSGPDVLGDNTDVVNPPAASTTTTTTTTTTSPTTTTTTKPTTSSTTTTQSPSKISAGLGSDGSRKTPLFGLILILVCVTAIFV